METHDESGRALPMPVTYHTRIAPSQDDSPAKAAYIDDYLDQVLNQCIELHGMAGSGESPVDCAFQSDLSAMHLSLPSIAYHNDHYQQIMTLEHHWCASAQSKTGSAARWVRHFRREKRIVSRPCYTGAELRRLLRYGEEREARQK